MHQQSREEEQEFLFKSLFIPLTTLKAIHWIIVIGFIVYANSLFNGFVGDDWGQIVDNINTHSLENIVSFFSSSTFYVPAAGNFGLYYKPIMMLAYSLLYTFFGSQAFVYHLLQLLLHIANSCLLFLLFFKFYSKKISFCLALLFLVHPINTEAVVYIANIQEVLFFFFGVICLLLLQGKPQLKKFLLIGLFGFLSLLSKETGILFVFILVVYTYLFNKNKYYYFVSLGILCSYLFLRIATVGLHIQSSETYLLSNGNFVERILSIPKIIFYYLSTFLFPKDIAAFQHWIVKTSTYSNFYLPLLVDLLFFLIVISFGVYFYIKNKHVFKNFLFFFIWFLLGLGFHSQLIALDMTVADRWFYFPIVGILGMAGIVVTYFGPKIKKVNLSKILMTVLILVVLAFSYRTFVRNFDWKNDYTLCSHDVLVNNNSYVLELCLGNEYRKLQKYDMAEHHLKNSISLFPKYYIAMYYLAKTYDEERNYSQAIEYYEKTVANNNWGYGADMLATLLVYHRNPQQAKEVAQANIKKQPQNGQLWYSLALAEYKLNDKSNAIIAAQNAYRLSPSELTKRVLEGIQKNLPLKFDNK